MIAGGAGITPIYSMTRGILSDPADQTRIQLLWGVNGTRDIILKSELEELEQKYPERLHVTYCVSGPEGKPEATSLGEPGKYKKGYINSEVLKEAVQCAQRGSWGDAKGTKVFICGPPAMQEAIAGKQGILGGEFGVAKKEIHMF
jgi:cytochrome-b5 reductase